MKLFDEINQAGNQTKISSIISKKAIDIMSLQLCLVHFYKVDDDRLEEKQTQAVETIRLCLSDQIKYHLMSPKTIWISWTISSCPRF
jgi:hypothetical protein